MPDHPLLRHFWLVILVVMLVNVAIWRRRLGALVAAGRASPAEVSAFVRGAAVAVAAFCLAAESVGLAAGWPSPLCVYGEPATAPGALAMWGLTAVAWALLLWWVWRGRGAATLARLGPALRNGPPRARPYTERQVRVAVTGVLALVAAATALNRVVMPDVPRCVARSGLTGR